MQTCSQCFLREDCERASLSALGKDAQTGTAELVRVLLGYATAIARGNNPEKEATKVSPELEAVCRELLAAITEESKEPRDPNLPKYGSRFVIAELNPSALLIQAFFFPAQA